MDKEKQHKIAVMEQAKLNEISGGKLFEKEKKLSEVSEQIKVLTQEKSTLKEEIQKIMNLARLNVSEVTV